MEPVWLEKLFVLSVLHTLVKYDSTVGPANVFLCSLIKVAIKN